MKQDESRSIDQFRDRLMLLYLLKYTLAALTVWAFLYGTAVLALRGAMHLPRLELLWGLVSLPLALIPAVILARRRLPSVNAVRAMLDRHARCGGLLMAGAEMPIDRWSEELPVVRQPGLSWRGGKSCALLSGGLAFVALAFLLPQGFANLAGGRLDVSKEAEKLAKQIDVLEQEKLLEKQRAGELKDKLEQVRRDAQGKDPVKTLESLDHLQELTSKTARDASESAARKMEELGRMETFAEALDRVGTKMEPSQLAEAMQKLSDLMKDAATERDLLDTGLDKETLDALKASSLTPEQMKKLLDALKDAKGITREKIGRLVKAKLLKPEDLEKCDKAGKCDCAGLAAFLKENGCKSGLCDAVALAEIPGKGGVSRGPAPAKLTFGDESTEDGTRFKEEELPPSQMQTLKDSRLAGISTAAPKIGKEKLGESAAGALAAAKSGGGSASTQVVLPRHRGAVERYFDRAKKK